MKIKAIAAILAASAIVSLTPGVANAQLLPSGCKSGFGYPPSGGGPYYYTWAMCTDGTGYVRADATCTNGSTNKQITGSWKLQDKQSSAHCPSTHPRAIAHAYTIKL
ncbi:hypothetical protein ACSDR0_48200 [Streptosporangium sp. G11]|uniref:hypothetical protein n=1 Tax=Streptosporangium sp. G11 TaxID=3436926 RepID=UPI003EB92B15